VFLIEARPEQPERLRVGQPVSVTLASTDAIKQAVKGDPKSAPKGGPK
jgi:hypothetical protein